MTTGFWALLYYFPYWVGARKIHPNEPTVIPLDIPFVGHVLGMATQWGPLRFYFPLTPYQ